MKPPVVLVMAKAPVPGEVKTRLGAETGMRQAAELAAAALLDTLEVCQEAFGRPACYLALSGSTADAVDGAALDRRLRDWAVIAQRGNGLGQRLRNAHHDTARLAGAAVVQLGMDTPHVSVAQLLEVASAVRRPGRAVLGPAEDGGWWVLALQDPRHAHGLPEVRMSSPRTCTDTHASLVRHGAEVAYAPVLRDIDTAADADAAALIAPERAFARVWARTPACLS